MQFSKTRSLISLTRWPICHPPLTTIFSNTLPATTQCPSQPFSTNTIAFWWHPHTGQMNNDASWRLVAIQGCCKKLQYNLSPMVILLNIADGHLHARQTPTSCTVMCCMLYRLQLVHIMCIRPGSKSFQVDWSRLDGSKSSRVELVDLN